MQSTEKAAASTLELAPWERYSSTEVVIAALNEQEGIGLTIRELQQQLFAPRILVIDGQSIDRTVEVSKDLGVDVLFQNGKGKGDAIAKAVEYTDEDVDYVIITDADFTYPAEYVPKMIDILEQNPYVGMVCGNRFNGNVNKKALWNRFYVGNKLLSAAHSFFNGVSLHDPLTGLRVVRADIFRDWKIKSNGFDIEVELNTLVERKGYQTIEIPIQYRERLGEKKLKVRDGFSILKRILLESLD
jgi:dolichol-phosphate mannosyltransferase